MRACGARRWTHNAMREGLDQWAFVLAAYAVAIAATLLLVGWSWLAMTRAERRREETRK